MRRAVHRPDCPAVPTLQEHCREPQQYRETALVPCANVLAEDAPSGRQGEPHGTLTKVSSCTSEYASRSKILSSLSLYDARSNFTASATLPVNTRKQTFASGWSMFQFGTETRSSQRVVARRAPVICSVIDDGDGLAIKSATMAIGLRGCREFGETQ